MRWQQVGNKTDCALLAFAHDLGFRYKEIGKMYHEAESLPVKVFPFSSARKRAGILYKVLDPPAGAGTKDSGAGGSGNGNGAGGNSYRLYVKGASEIVLSLCESRLSVTDATVSPFSASAKQQMRDEVIAPFAKQSLRTIALAYKDLDFKGDASDPAFVASLEKILSEDEAVKLTGQNADTYEMEVGLTFLGLVGIEDPLRETVPPAIKQCNLAGVDVRMVTGDNIDTAIAISKQCGILRPGLDLNADGSVKENVALAGPEFRKRVSFACDRVHGTATTRFKSKQRTRIHRIPKLLHRS